MDNNQQYITPKIRKNYQNYQQQQQQQQQQQRQQFQRKVFLKNLKLESELELQGGQILNSQQNQDNENQKELEIHFGCLDGVQKWSFAIDKQTNLAQNNFIRDTVKEQAIQFTNISVNQDQQYLIVIQKGEYRSYIQSLNNPSLSYEINVQQNLNGLIITGVELVEIENSYHIVISSNQGIQIYKQQGDIFHYSQEISQKFCPKQQVNCLEIIDGHYMYVGSQNYLQIWDLKDLCPIKVPYQSISGLENIQQILKDSENRQGAYIITNSSQKSRFYYLEKHQNLIKINSQDIRFNISKVHQFKFNGESYFTFGNSSLNQQFNKFGIFICKIQSQFQDHKYDNNNNRSSVYQNSQQFKKMFLGIQDQYFGFASRVIDVYGSEIANSEGYKQPIVVCTQQNTETINEPVTVWTFNLPKK